MFRRLVAAAAIAVLSAAIFCVQAANAQVAPASPVATPSTVVRATFANGMRVILLPNKLAPVATTLVAYGVGSNDDTIPGIAHATEHMLFRGTTTVSAGQLADIAARMGAQYNAFTLNESTVYYYKLPSAYVDVALHIEADRMTHATVLAAAWQTERGAIEQEVRAQESIPGSKIGEKLRGTFFHGTPFAETTVGTIAGFDKMTADDIRSFYKTWYAPSNATLIIAGDIDPARTMAVVRAQFEPLRAGAVPAHKAIDVPVLQNATLQDTMDFPIGFGALAYRLPGSKAPDYAAALVIGRVFQSGRTALADLVASGKMLGALNLTNAFPEVGADFLLGIPAAGAPPSSVQALLAGVLDAYRTNGIPPELIESAKMRLLSEQAYSQSSISGLGLAWADTALNGTTPDERYQAIAAVTNEDVQRVFRTYFSTDHQISIAITAKPTGAMAKTDPTAGTENIGYTPTVHEPLPAWAKGALNAPLRAPADDLGAATGHLSNGLQYIARQESVAPTVVLRGYIRTDSNLYSPPGKDGVSVMVHQLLPYGTEQHDRKAYEAQFDAIAGSVELGTAFTLQVQAKDFERGVELLAEGMLHPAFPPTDFPTVKTSVGQNVGVANKLPKTKADLAQRLALYPPGDPRRRDITEKTIAAITLGDVKRYYRFAYRPDEATIAVVGDVSAQRVRDALQKYFGAWRSQGARPTFRYPALRPVASGNARTVRVHSKTNTQSEVTMKQLLRLKRSDADYVPLLLANTILSDEGTGSLLFQELRTRRGFVYSTASSVSVDSTGGEFAVTFASDPKNVAPASAAVIAIIKRLQTQPLPGVELQRAKALLLAQRTLPLDSYAGVADDMLSAPRSGYAYTGSEVVFWRKLLRVSPSDLEQAMRRIKADNFLRVVVEGD